MTQFGGQFAHPCGHSYSTDALRSRAGCMTVGRQLSPVRVLPLILMNGSLSADDSQWRLTRQHELNWGTFGCPDMTSASSQMFISWCQKFRTELWLHKWEEGCCISYACPIWRQITRDTHQSTLSVFTLIALLGRGVNRAQLLFCGGITE